MNKWFYGEFFQTFKELTSILLKLFQKLKKRKWFQIHFTRSPLPWKQSQKKTDQGKKTAGHNPWWTDTKVLNKILANWIQSHISMIMRKHALYMRIWKSPTLKMMGEGRRKELRLLSDITQGLEIILLLVLKNNTFPFYLNQTESEFSVTSQYQNQPLDPVL